MQNVEDVDAVITSSVSFLYPFLQFIRAIVHRNPLIFSILLFSVLVAYKTPSGPSVQQRMHLKWFDSIYSYLNRLLATVPVPTQLAMIPRQTYTRPFWSSWFQRGRIITSWGVSIIIVKASQGNTSIFLYQSLCCKSIYKIMKTIAHDITICYRPRIISSSNILSPLNVFVKRPMVDRNCRARGEIGFSA